MKELILHCDYVKYNVERKTKVAEGIEDSQKSKHLENVLFVRMAIEKEDEAGISSVAEKTVEDLNSLSEQVKTKNVLIYPYAHLLYGSEPAGAEKAIELMKLVEDKLRAIGFEVTRAPFGWYKAFEFKCKGHPLSELSRIIRPEGAEAKKGEVISQALKAEEKLKSEWYVIEPSGKLNPIGIADGKISGFDFSGHENLKKYVKYELAKDRTAKEEPAHVRLMRKLELADYEPASDPGNLRYPPKGRLVKSLIEDWVTKKSIDYGAMEIEAPIMYDIEHPALKAYFNRFPARQYNIETPNKKVFLRFASCTGQFLMLHDATVSYKQLPLKLYELTRYSFRVEKHGELAGLRRLRAFTMPDCHAFCADMEQAKGEMLKRFELARQVQEGFGFKLGEFEFAIRVVKEFWENNKEFVLDIIRKMGKPVLVEVWAERFFYFVLKYEWNFVDASDKASTLATDQIDIENGERYDLRYADAEGKPKHPIILHLSPSGAVERIIYALLEKSGMLQAKGGNPIFPLWLSPTQIRLASVNDSHLPFCNGLADELEKNGIRADIDDRLETIGKKIRGAEVEWVPYTIVVGDKETGGGKLSVRTRETGKVEEMGKDELMQMVRSQTDGKPYKSLSLPRLLSNRPTFIG